jgi:hypothetical protein
MIKRVITAGWTEITIKSAELFGTISRYLCRSSTETRVKIGLRFLKALKASHFSATDRSAPCRSFSNKIEFFFGRAADAFEIASEASRSASRGPSHGSADRSLAQSIFVAPATNRRRSLDCAGW